MKNKISTRWQHENIDELFAAKFALVRAVRGLPRQAFQAPQHRQQGLLATLSGSQIQGRLNAMLSLEESQ